MPIAFAIEGDRIATAVDAKPKAGTELARLGHVRADPRVSLLVDEYADDWTHLWWVRADGAARVVEDGPELAWAFDLLRERYPQYAAVELIGPAIVVEVERWTGWSAAGR